jgi:PRC-barrel domain
MALHKIKDFYPDYRDQLDDQDIIGYSLYSGEEKVGSVDDLLVDDEGKFRYLVINTGAWIFGKKVLLPIGRSQIDYSQHRVNVTGLSRSQVENLPEYDGSMVD